MLEDVKRPDHVELLFVGNASRIHLYQTGAADATSLHVYSPPLGEMGFYEVAADGTLSRRTGDYREEFC